MGGVTMKVTIEHAIGADAISSLYVLYARAFDPLRTRAAARHLLSADEFTAEMLDGRIDKYVVWDDDGQPVALTTLITDLSAVPWVSADFFAARYPGHAARGALYYVGYTLVHPDRERDGIAGRLLARIVRRLHNEGVVCGFDVSAHNDEVHHIGASIGRLGRSLPVRVDSVDVQSYYAADFSGDRG